MTMDGLLSENVRKKLDLIKQSARSCTIIFAGGEEYKATECTTKFVVHLGNRTCGCGAWNISEIPCKHACVCIQHKRAKVEEYCDWYFTRNNAYIQAHREWIHPISDEDSWPQIEHDPVMPPPLMRLPGRPRKNRRKEPDKPASRSISRRATTVKCCICKAFGHNKRTCQRTVVGSNSKRPRRGGVHQGGRGHGGSAGQERGIGVGAVGNNAGHEAGAVGGSAGHEAGAGGTGEWQSTEVIFWSSVE